jgi:hypothetical protein
MTPAYGQQRGEGGWWGGGQCWVRWVKVLAVKALNQVITSGENLISGFTDSTVFLQIYRFFFGFYSALTDKSDRISILKNSSIFCFISNVVLRILKVTE